MSQFLPSILDGLAAFVPDQHEVSGIVSIPLSVDFQGLLDNRTEVSCDCLLFKWRKFVKDKMTITGKFFEPSVRVYYQRAFEVAKNFSSGGYNAHL